MGRQFVHQFAVSSGELAVVLEFPGGLGIDKDREAGQSRRQVGDALLVALFSLEPRGEVTRAGVEVDACPDPDRPPVGTAVLQGPI